jgi:hypothetical protein
LQPVLRLCTAFLERRGSFTGSRRNGAYLNLSVIPGTRSGYRANGRSPEHFGADFLAYRSYASRNLVGNFDAESSPQLILKLGEKLLQVLGRRRAVKQAVQVLSAPSRLHHRNGSTILVIAATYRVDEAKATRLQAQAASVLGITLTVT